MTTDELYRAWHGFKQLFELSGRLTPNLLHIIFGVVLFIILYVVFGRSTRSAILAWAIIFAAQAFNEIIDIYFSIMRYGDIHVRNTIKDFIATLFIPSIAVLVVATGFAARCKILLLKFIGKS